MKIRDRIKELRRVPACDLLPNPKNWRTHPAAQADALRGVLGEVGFADAVLARETENGLMLIDGHLRAEVAPDASVPVLVLDVTQDEADKILATHDPLAAMATTDAGQLADLLKGMRFDSDAAMAMTESLAKAEGIAQAAEVIEDEVPEPPADPVTEPGDLWTLGDHRVLCGDATASEDVGRVMDGQLAQIIFTDPPYGVGYDGGAKRRESLAGDGVGTDVYSSFLPHASQHSDDNVAIYVWHADSHAAAVAVAAAAAGFKIVAQIIWAKNHAQFVTSAHYKGKHEPCYYGHKEGRAARWHGPNNEVTLWEYPRSPRNDYHPTQKPVPLAVRALNNSSDKADAVLDPFLGSGTTLIAAEQLGRKCYGLEISPAYCDVIVNRWESLTGRKAERNGERKVTKTNKAKTPFRRTKQRSDKRKRAGRATRSTANA